MNCVLNFSFKKFIQFIFVPCGWNTDISIREAHKTRHLPSKTSQYNNMAINPSEGYQKYELLPSMTKDFASVLSRFNASFIAFCGTCSEPLFSFSLDTLLSSWLYSRVRQGSSFESHSRSTINSSQQAWNQSHKLETRTCVKVLSIGRLNN